MKLRGLGVLLVLALIVAGGALGQNLRFDNSLARDRAASAALRGRLSALAVTVSELRAAQAGYVATGQDPEYWIAQVSTQAGRLETELADLAATTSGDGARPHYQAAQSALSEFNSIDDRARSYVGDRQLFLASDLIFMDSLDAIRRVASTIGAARDSELQQAEASLARTAWIRFGMNSAAFAFILVSAILAIRAGSRTEPANVESDVDVVAVLDMDDERAAADELAGTDPDSAPPVIIRDAGVSRASLENTADLCADLARLLDGRDLPAIVERTAKILDARGVVLWASDTAGALLQPALTHGYSDRVVRRLGSLQIDGDNVTSLAFRSLRPQTMNGAAEDAPGAVAIPLVTTSGCIGVLSAETRGRRPAAETLALARIVAAQFATVIQPVAGETAVEKSAEG